MLKLVRSRGVREERTEHTKTFHRTLAGFGLTWGQKVNFSIFDGKLTFQCPRNCHRNHPFCPGSLQDTFIIYSSILHQHIFRKYVIKIKCVMIKKLETWKSKNPGSLTGAQSGGCGATPSPHPTPPHPTPPNPTPPHRPTPPHMAFSEIYWAFPVNRRSHLPAVRRCSSEPEGGGEENKP